MADYIDISSTTTALTQRAINRLLNKIDKHLWPAINRAVNSMSYSYSNYVEQKKRSVSKVKNFIYDREPGNLSELYVDLEIAGSKSSYNTSSLFKVLLNKRGGENPRDAGAIIIRGRAGTGKSFFLKHLFIELSNSPGDRIPVFVELREVNKRKLTDIATVIFEEINSYNANISLSQFTEGLKAGSFVILIDGFDELKPIVMSHYESEILGFCKKYHECPLAMTGRPIPLYGSWSDFEIFDINPLTTDQSVEMINNLDFDAEDKERFVSRIKENLFESHKEYLEIPLLCVIMLITFADTGKISNRDYEFYEDAYSALWGKHDGKKQGYERQKYTKLERSAFKRLTSGFALSSYHAGHFDLKDDECEAHFENASNLSGINSRLQEFIKDLTVSTSLAVIDGPVVRFSHRSFHEYFAAVAIANADDALCGELMDNVVDWIDRDDVVFLCHSLDRPKIERAWIFPKLEYSIGKLDIFSGDTIQYALKLMQGFEVRKRINVNKKSSDAFFIECVRLMYGLSPREEELRAAYEAAIDMGTGSKEMCLKRDPDILKLFLVDINNIRRTYEEINLRLNQRKKSVQIFYRGSQKGVNCGLMPLVITPRSVRPPIPRSSR